jgi:hypothetical protein
MVAMALLVSIFGHTVRNRLIASLIVCVALLTQFGASLWGAVEAREGLPNCHRNIAWSATADVTRPDVARHEAPAQKSAGHDHGSCSLCQLSFGLFYSEAPVFEARVVTHQRVSLSEPADLDVIVTFNRSAPARASPSVV